MWAPPSPSLITHLLPPSDIPKFVTDSVLVSSFPTCLPLRMLCAWQRMLVSDRSVSPGVVSDGTVAQGNQLWNTWNLGCLFDQIPLSPLDMNFWQGLSLAEVMAPLRKLVHLINGEYLLAHCQALPLIKLPHFELSLEEGYGGN